jgi:hypothetical protein
MVRQRSTTFDSRGENVEEKPKRVRAKRRNYQEIVKSTLAYCEAAVSVIATTRAAISAEKIAGVAMEFAPYLAHMDGQIDAMKAVIKRLEGGE